MKGKVIGGIIAAIIIYMIINNPEGFGDTMSTIMGFIFDFFDGIGKVLERIFS